MADTSSNKYSLAHALNKNAFATAAALELVSQACSASGNTDKINILEWASQGSNLKDLRDKIIECAKE